MRYQITQVSYVASPGAEVLVGPWDMIHDEFPLLYGTMEDAARALKNDPGIKEYFERPGDYFEIYELNDNYIPTGVSEIF